jgi:RimJ/RimL family protein N-acetyltransferase
MCRVVLQRTVRRLLNGIAERDGDALRLPELPVALRSRSVELDPAADQAEASLRKALEDADYRDSAHWGVTSPVDDVVGERAAQERRARERNFAVLERETGRLVGRIEVSRVSDDRERLTIGYWTAPAFRGRGYASDALTTVTAWIATATDVRFVDLLIEPGNDASRRVAEKCGYAVRSWKARLRALGPEFDVYRWTRPARPDRRLR